MAMRALHEILCEVLGSKNCYFEPPADLQMSYPCIVYKYTNDLDDFADNLHIVRAKRYSVTVIDEDPDSKIPDRLKMLPYCTSDRNFTVNGLKHFVHELFYNGPRVKEVDT